MCCVRDGTLPTNEDGVCHEPYSSLHSVEMGAMCWLLSPCISHSVLCTSWTLPTNEGGVCHEPCSPLHSVEMGTMCWLLSPCIRHCVLNPSWTHPPLRVVCFVNLAPLHTAWRWAACAGCCHHVLVTVCCV